MVVGIGYADAIAVPRQPYAQMFSHQVKHVLVVVCCENGMPKTLAPEGLMVAIGKMTNLKLKHKVPCSECPWRKVAAKGWLGGYKPEHYADAVQNNEVPACHNKDFGPNSPKTAMCVGSLAVMANSCILPHKTPGGLEARNTIGKRDDCFGHYSLFYQYHAGEPYVHPLLRK